MKMIPVKCKCMMCGKEESHEYPEDGLQKWQSGMKIQDAMPERNVFEREFLIVKMCFDCISKMYNRPKPGEDWGEVVAECEECGCPLYAKDNGLCPTCKTQNIIE